ncbi:MAG: hypothetical protein ACPHL6_13120 [Rubripirellula sp.]
MPIQIRCQCGKSLSAPDAAAGKAVKCPGCQKTLKVPAKSSPAKVAAPQPQPAAPKGDLDDLFDEEGFDSTIESVCPACREPMTAAAVLCTKCGFHRESGVKFESHKTAGVDIDHGTLALQKAESDMIQAAEMQKKLTSGPGMPWWGLALVLFVMGSGLVIATLAVNASRRVDATAPANPMGLFFTLTAVAFGLVAAGAYIMIVVHAFKQSAKEGLICLATLPLLPIFHVIKNPKETWKLLFVLLLTAGIAGGFGAAAANAFANPPPAKAKK